jgi:hypothetical protein
MKKEPVDSKSEQLIQSAKDILCEWLDNEKGSTITEMGIFMELAKK